MHLKYIWYKFVSACKFLYLLTIGMIINSPVPIHPNVDSPQNSPQTTFCESINLEHSVRPWAKGGNYVNLTKSNTRSWHARRLGSHSPPLIFKNKTTMLVAGSHNVKLPIYANTQATQASRQTLHARPAAGRRQSHPAGVGSHLRHH